MLSTYVLSPGYAKLVITAKKGVKDKFRAFASETGCRGGGSDTLADGSFGSVPDTDMIESCFLKIFGGHSGQDVVD